jgi:CRISPR-associated protein Cmr4
MYHKAYGIIETQAPLHVGASAGEESGNLNLIFRDQFTQTGIIPGSSIRGRFRADMRQENGNADDWYGKAVNHSKSEESESDSNRENNTSEGLIKFEYASLVWLPVYCPNQPIVRVSCPALLKRYQKITRKPAKEFEPYNYFGKTSSQTLFFNLGFLKLKKEDESLWDYIPQELDNANQHLLVVVDDTEISMIHDMALYRQSRVALEPDKKKAKGGAFFDVEALPEGTVMAFPVAMRKQYNGKPVDWKQFLTDGQLTDQGKELYFGGLESIGFGRTQVFLKSLD